MKLLRLFVLLLTAFFINSCVQKPTVTVFQPDQELKIAMILPNKLIGRYAHTTSTAVFAYFLTREHPFTIKTFQIIDESPEEIERVLEEIKEADFHYVIAPVTPKGAKVISEREEELTLFFPTIHKNDIPDAPNNIYFGAIDYKAQIEKLTPLMSSPLVIMYDESAQGQKLLKMTSAHYLASDKPFHPTGRLRDAADKKAPYAAASEPKEKKVIAYGIDKMTSNLKAQLDANEKIQYGSFMLNTPLIKSSMILSQLSVYDTAVTNTLSTQINYDPLILTMTQRKDRESLYIANSIGVQNDAIVQANALLNNNIVYDWINYASTIGADYFYHRITAQPRLYDLPIENNQVIYPITIVQPAGSHFKVVEDSTLQ